VAYVLLTIACPRSHLRVFVRFWLLLWDDPRFWKSASETECSLHAIWPEPTFASFLDRCLPDAWHLS
jgi:hypothetical protein